MTEIGWPLIPREVLPAPVPAAKRRPLPRIPVPDGGRQLPFFGAETTEPSPTDLAGLLAGPGRLGRMGGTARVSVEVDAAWRVHVLVAELVARGLVANWRPIQDQHQDQDQDLVRDDVPPGSADVIPAVENHQEPQGDPIEDLPPEEPDPWADPPPEPKPVPRPEPKPAPEPAPEPIQPAKAAPPQEESEEHEAAEEGAEDPPPEPKLRFEVLTAYSSRLIGLARAWPEVSEQLFLSGPRLRLWVAAAGEPIPGGYALGLDPGKDVAAIDAALVRAGLAGRLSDDGTHMRIMGKRRVRRLAELVGERPEAAPEEMWPGSAAA
jgi:hypothetical protein